MEARRYRLRFVPGVALTAFTYGSATYGSGTYGQQATDPLTSIRYQLAPKPSGYLSDPSWLYRQGDTQPRFEAQVHDGDGPIVFTGLDFALLVLQPDDGRTDGPWIYDLTREATTNGDVLARDWQPYDLGVAGSYRAGVVLTYTSGRRLTVPNDDRHHFVITPNPAFTPADPDFVSRWDDARWDFANWTGDKP